MKYIQAILLFVGLFTVIGLIVIYGLPIIGNTIVNALFTVKGKAAALALVLAISGAVHAVVGIKK